MNVYIHFLNVIYINSVSFGQTDIIVRKYFAHNLGSFDSLGFVRLPPHDLINETDLTWSDWNFFQLKLSETNRIFHIFWTLTEFYISARSVVFSYDGHFYVRSFNYFLFQLIHRKVWMFSTRIFNYFQLRSKILASACLRTSNNVENYIFSIYLCDGSSGGQQTKSPYAFGAMSARGQFFVYNEYLDHRFPIYIVFSLNACISFLTPLGLYKLDLWWRITYTLETKSIILFQSISKIRNYRWIGQNSSVIQWKFIL